MPGTAGRDFQRRQIAKYKTRSSNAVIETSGRTAEQLERFEKAKKEQERQLNKQRALSADLQAGLITKEEYQKYLSSDADYRTQADTREAARAAFEKSKASMAFMSAQKQSLDLIRQYQAREQPGVRLLGTSIDPVWKGETRPTGGTRNDKSGVRDTVDWASVFDSTSRRAEEKALEAQIEFSEKWRKGIARRSERIDDVFRGKGGDTWIEEFGRKGLGVPARLVTELPETVLWSAQKASIIPQALLFKESRQSTIIEMSSAFGRVPKAAAAIFDVRKPARAVDLLTIAVIPSAELKVAGETSKISALFATAGKRRVPAESVFYGPSVAKLETGVGRTFPFFGGPSASLKKFQSATKMVLDETKQALIKSEARGGFPSSVWEWRDAAVEKVFITHSAPSKIKGLKTPAGLLVQVEASPKFAKGKIETKGLYGTPGGEGSPFFLRLPGTPGTQYEFSLLPKFSLSSPRAYEITVENVFGLPRKVAAAARRKKGAENEFLLSEAQSGDAFITGNMYRGKKESEAVRPEKSFILMTGAERFTKIKGTNILVEEGRSLTYGQVENLLGSLPQSFTKGRSPSVLMESIPTTSSSSLMRQPVSLAGSSAAALSILSQTSSRASPASSALFSTSGSPIIWPSSRGSSVVRGGVSYSPRRPTSLLYSGASSRASSILTSESGGGRSSSGPRSILVPEQPRGPSSGPPSTPSSILTPRSTYTPRTPRTPGYSLITPRTPRNPPFFPTGTSRIPRGRGSTFQDIFTVQVRKGGKFMTIGKKRRKEAFALGLREVRGTPRASFRLLTSSGAPFAKGLFPTGDVYRSRKEPGVFIEKSRFRINTLGELTGITGKARRKRNFWGL